jgi:hypothetical protein
MTGNGYSTQSGKKAESFNASVNSYSSDSKTKIAVLHYSHDASSMGVSAVLGYNKTGISKINPNVDLVLYGHELDDKLNGGHEKVRVNLTGEFHKDLSEKLNGVDYVLVENPFRDLESYPRAYKEYKKLVEANPDKKFVFRHHDVDLGLENPVPSTPNVQHVTLIGATKDFLKNNYGVNADILSNSLDFDQFYKPRQGKGKELEGLLQDEGYVYPLEKINGSLNRLVRRKNAEEALLHTYILNNVYGENYRLMMSSSIREEKEKLMKTNPLPGNKVPDELEYENMILDLAKDFEIPFSLGFSHLIDGKKYTPGDFLAISDVVSFPSKKEGFGYSLPESIAAGVPHIIRTIPGTTEEFIRKGLDLSYAYGNETFPIDHDLSKFGESVDNIRNILSNPVKLHEVAMELNLPWRIEASRNLLGKNQPVVEREFGCEKIAMRLLDKFGIEYNKIGSEEGVVAA